MKERRDVNRAAREGKKIYCDIACAGWARRVARTEDELRERKRLYDMEYREKNKESRKEQKRLWHAKTYNSELAAKQRAKLKREKPEQEQKRRDYMQSSKYKSEKKAYDRMYRAKRDYGDEWADCAVLSLEIREECLSQASDYEIRVQAGTLNKQLKRRREYEKLNSNKPEIGSLGDLEQPQG